MAARRLFLGGIAVVAAFLLLVPVAGGARKPTTNLRQVRAPSIAVAPTFAPLVKPPRQREGELIVRFKRGTSEAARASLHGRRKGRRLKKLVSPDAELVSVDPSRNEKSVAQAYERSGEVLYAEPNFIYTLANTYPAASELSQLWALDNTGQSVNGTVGRSDADMDVVEAWDKTTGDYGVVVGVVDSGVDDTHSDLASSMWLNNGETGGTRSTNGVDDDQNGRIDDYRGYDFVSNDNNPSDPIGHGTAVASTIGANGAPGAVRGVSPIVGLAPLRACDQTGFCDAADVAEAFDYAGDHGMKVVSAALSGPDPSQAIEDEINAHPQTLYVVAAGNGGGDGAADNVDAPGQAQYPCSDTPANVLCIAASDQNDELAGFSNYGPISVDAAAPGVNVLAAWPGNKVAFQNGTSVATGYAAGAAALVSSASLSQSSAGVKSRLVNSADIAPGFAGTKTFGGRLDVRGALPPATVGQHGTLDANFDGDGRLTTTFSGCQEAHDTALQRDGKIIAVGETVPCAPDDRDFAVARYHGDGSLDTTWDGDGKVVTDIVSGSEDVAYAVATDPGTGKIVVAGSSTTGSAGFGDQVTVVRYNQNGTLDTSFDGDGKARFDVGALGEVAKDVLVQSDSKIVVVGYRGFGANQDFTIGRLNEDGSFDSSFNSGSWVATDFTSAFSTADGLVGNGDTALEIERQPDGKYVAAGKGGAIQSGNSLGHNLALARYDTNGSLDTTFDGDGKVVTDSASQEEARGLALSGNTGPEDIVAAGYSSLGEDGRIAFSSDRDGNSEIYSMSPQGTGLTKLTNNSALDADPSWRPDGQRIYFTSNRDGDEEIWSMAPDGTGALQWTTNGSSDNQPSLSPDGSGFVFVSDRDGNGEIYMTYGGGAQINLTSNPALDHNPDWSPDGSKVVFASNRDGDNDIYTMDPDGTDVTNITNNAAQDAYPSYKPDGSKILFHTDRDGNDEVYEMNPNGSSPTNLTNNSASDSLANWSGGGQKIVFQTNRDAGNFEIYSMNSNGSGQTRLTTNSAVDDLADWQPLPAMGITRYNPDGSLDTGFGSGGKQTVDYSGGAAAGDVEVQNNSDAAGTGKIVLAGSAYATAFDLSPVPLYSLAARLQPDGSLDNQFGTGGKAFDGNTPGEQRSLAMQRDGNIVTAGGLNGSSTFSVRRLIGGQATINVTPNTGLARTGQSVLVTASGLEPSTPYAIDQCRPGTCAGTQFTSTASGTLSESVNVDETVDGNAANCPDPDCFVRVSRVVTNFQTVQTITAPISFSGQSSLELTPSAGLISQNQSVLVGQPITLSAAVKGGSGGGSPTGNVSFFACGPLAPPATCSGGTALPGNPKALAGGEGGSFTAPTNFTVGDRPLSVATADFNADADPDLAVANHAADTISVLLGSVGGTFSAPTNLAAGNGPHSVAVGNFNTDSDPDIAVANSLSDEVSIFLGSTGASFTGPTDFSTGDGPQSVAVGDFNGDSDPDLATANEISNNVSILPGGSGGTFTSPTDFAVGQTPFSVAVGNFNGDSDPDLATANVDSQNVSVLLGGTGASFSAPTNFTADASPFSLAVGDFNSDSDPDLAVANLDSDNVSVLLGAAGGSFTAPTNLSVGNEPRSVTVGNFNGDSDPDLVAGNESSDNVSVLLGEAGGTFSAPTNFTVGDAPRSVAVGNFDGDSDADLVTTNSLSDNISILLGGPGNTASAVSDPISFATPGRYCFRAAYAGSADHRGSSDASKASCINVRQPTPALQATDDFYPTPLDGTLLSGPSGGVIQNDLYPAGAIVGTGCSTTGHVCASLDQDGLKGAATVNPDGSFTYDPDPGETGTDTFTYRLEQAGGGDSIGTVTVEISESPELLQAKRTRAKRTRAKRTRDILEASLFVYSECRTRFVWVNPQITVPEPTEIKVTAALYDSAGERLASSDYIVDDIFYGDPFAPTVLTWPVWATPAPGDGAYVEVFIEATPLDSLEPPYTVNGSVLCAT